MRKKKIPIKTLTIIFNFIFHNLTLVQFEQYNNLKLPIFNENFWVTLFSGLFNYQERKNLYFGRLSIWLWSNWVVIWVPPVPLGCVDRKHLYLSLLLHFFSFHKQGLWFLLLFWRLTIIPFLSIYLFYSSLKMRKITAESSKYKVAHKIFL